MISSLVKDAYPDAIFPELEFDEPINARLQRYPLF